MSGTFSLDDLDRAVTAGAIDRAAADGLARYLNTQAPDVVGKTTQSMRVRFDLVHVLWYAGALLIIGAMGIFSTLAFSALGGKALILTALVYGGLFLAAGEYLWTKRGLTTPGGLLVAAAVSMVTLLVYGIQETYDMWGEAKPGTVRDFYIWIKSGWLPMELATLAAATLALTRYRFPFLVAILAFVLWFMSMDLAAWLAGDRGSWEFRRQFSIFYGLAMIAVAWLVDLKQRKADFAFWLHLFGGLIFWGAISMKGGGTAFEKTLYGVLNTALLFFGVYMNRRIYAVFGAIGLLILLGDLSRDLFKDAFLFPFVLTGIGIAVIALGLWYLKHRDSIGAAMDRILPPTLHSLRPPHARST